MNGLETTLIRKLAVGLQRRRRSRGQNRGRIWDRFAPIRIGERAGFISRKCSNNPGGVTITVFIFGPALFLGCDPSPSVQLLVGKIEPSYNHKTRSYNLVTTYLTGILMALDIDLKGKQFQEFQAALLHAFPAYNPLKIMVMHQLGENLSNIVAVDAMPNVVFELITWAKANGRLSELLAGALEQNPGNPYLRRFGLELTMTTDVLPEGRLQSLVLKGIPFVGSATYSVVKWKQLMYDAERCVCRVEMPNGVPRGTGFLVGKDIVMTNWHVVREVAGGVFTSDQVTLRFDYKSDVSGTPPIGSPAALMSDWLLDSSPERELDYALLRLSNPAGDDRGTLTPQPYAFPPNHPLFILQHPGGVPLILQVGTITSINTLHKRVNYTTNTAAGSSGSPCFTTAWNPVALHHYGQKTSNMGIPLEEIKEHVRQTKPFLADELGW